MFCVPQLIHVCILLSARHSRSRNYKAEFASCRLEAVPLEFGDYHPLKPITVSLSGAPYLILSLHKITGLIWGLSHLPAVAGFAYLFLLVFYFRFFCVCDIDLTHSSCVFLPFLVFAGLTQHGMLLFLKWTFLICRVEH